MLLASPPPDGSRVVEEPIRFFLCDLVHLAELRERFVELTSQMREPHVKRKVAVTACDVKSRQCGNCFAIIVRPLLMTKERS